MRGTSRLAALLLLAAATGCGGDDGGEGESHDAANSGAQFGAEEIRCRVGEKPRYFVPGPPAVIAGCVRLGISGNPLELSVQAETPETVPRLKKPLDIVCVNPAFPSRGPEAGLYIPEVCPNDPVPPEGRIDLQAIGENFKTYRPRRRPRLEAYELVLVGVLPGIGFDQATLVFGGDDGYAAVGVGVPVFEIGRALADRIGASRPFSFVAAELPIEAACDPVTIEARGPAPVSLTEPVKEQRCENLTGER